jgi:hypothetical protein
LNDNSHYVLSFNIIYARIYSFSTSITVEQVPSKTP